MKPARIASIAVFVIALVILAGVAYAIVGSRNGLTDYRSAFGLLGQLGRIGAGAFVIALIAWAAALRTKAGGAAYAATASVLLAVTVGSLYINQAAPPSGPPMNDITTDLEDPPVFAAVIPLRPTNSNPVEYGGAEVANNQRRVHPEVQPIISTLAPPQSFARALEVARGLGWDIVAEDSETGIIEAIDTTRFFRFKDDIVIRVRVSNGGSRIDLRSRSRIGRSDLGKNAARIMQFTDAYPMRG